MGWGRLYDAKQKKFLAEYGKKPSDAKAKPKLTNSRMKDKYKKEFEDVDE